MRRVIHTGNRADTDLQKFLIEECFDNQHQEPDVVADLVRATCLCVLVAMACPAPAQRRPVLFQIQVAPATTFLVPNQSFQFHAQRTFFRGGTESQFQEDVTTKAVWTSTDPTIAQVSGGKATATSKTGVVTVQAALGRLIATAQLNVSSTVMLNSIAVTPANQVGIFPGNPVSYAATGTYSDNSTQSLTSTAAWSSSRTTVATMSNNVANIAGTGNTTITATAGSVIGSAQLSVVPKLTVTPPSAALAFSQTQQFSANLPVTWSVDGIPGGNSTVGAISTAGVYAATLSSIGNPHIVSAATTTPPAQKVNSSVQVVSGFQGVLTYHNDNARTGLNANEVSLNPSNVNMTQFGKLFVLSVDGRVDAQPLYVPSLNIPGKGAHNILIVATEHDSIYAFDADIGTTFWQSSMLKSGETPSDDRGCSQVTPEIGVTATPAIDLSSGPHGTVYVVAMSKNGGTYFQRIHALDLTTGAEQFGGPQLIQGTFPGTGEGNDGNGHVIFDPSQYKERDGMLALNGRIYLAWASHCDIDPYTGWVMAYDETTLAQTSVLDTTPNGSEGAYRNSGGGLTADASGNVYQMVGNGTFDTTLNAQGFPNLGDYGNSFMKLSTSSGLAVSDYFAMFNTVDESNTDTDLGSGGAMVLPDMKDVQGRVRHLAVGAGKDGNIYVVDRDNMGKFVPNSTSNGQIYQELAGAVPGGIYSSPAYFNGNIYFGAVGDPLRAFQFANALLSATPGSISSQSYEYPGATPSISSAVNSNGILWVAENSDPAVLHAYDANDLTNELYNSSQAPSGRDNFGSGNKFITPTIANGKVYVGTTNGVGVFGLF